MNGFENNREEWRVKRAWRKIEKHILDSAYDWMIPLEFSFNSLMDAKHKIEKEFCRNQCQDRLEKKTDIRTFSGKLSWLKL